MVGWKLTRALRRPSVARSEHNLSETIAEFSAVFKFWRRHRLPLASSFGSSRAGGSDKR